MPLPHREGVEAELLGPPRRLDDLGEPFRGRDLLPSDRVRSMRDDVEDLEAHQEPACASVSAVTVVDAGSASSPRPQRSRTCR